jgi:hypothetical protein
MKARLMAGVVAVAVAVSFSWAQEITPSVGAGSKAMLFTFSGLSFLGAGAYNGGVGVKYFLTSNIGLRGSLIGGYGSQTVKTTLTSGGKDGSNSGSTIGIALGAEYHLTFARVSPFIGGTGMFSSTSTKQVIPVNVVGGSETTDKNLSTQLTFVPGKTLSLGGIGGVEFFITKELSLSAEYQLGYAFPIGYTTTHTVVTGGVTQETKTDVEGITRLGITNTGALTLAVYF